MARGESTEICSTQTQSPPHTTIKRPASVAVCEQTPCEQTLCAEHSTREQTDASLAACAFERSCSSEGEDDVFDSRLDRTANKPRTTSESVGGIPKQLLTSSNDLYSAASLSTQRKSRTQTPKRRPQSGDPPTQPKSPNFMERVFRRRNSEEAVVDRVRFGRRLSEFDLVEGRETRAGSCESEKEEFAMYSRAKTVVVKADYIGFGFNIRGCNPSYISLVIKDGPGARAGLKVNDLILRVDEHDVSKDSHKDVYNIVRNKYFGDAVSEIRFQILPS